MNSSVLVVDDDRAICMSISDALSRQEYEVAWEIDAAAAFRCIEERPFDVVVTDLKLGNASSGLHICQRMARERPDVPVVVITASGSMDTAIEAIRAGAYDYMTKPLDLHALALTLDRAVTARRLREEVKHLPHAVAEASRLDDMIGASAPMESMFQLVRQLGDSDASVIITGESGAGKELVARALHRASPRASGPFVAVSCAAVPATLLESELFGHVRGAFTDAKLARQGLFTKADGGTLFLDEIGEMPQDMQSKLLRVLQERKVRPIGATEELPFDTRIIAATNRDLDAEVENGTFRQDLYYRIDVVGIHVPPLRVRGNDILLLAQRFIDVSRARTGKQVVGLSCQAAQKLLEYTWPGNVRELENCIERAVTVAHFEQILVDDLPDQIRSHQSAQPFISDDPDELPTLDDLERRYIQQVLEATGGNKAQASRILGLNRRTLYRWIDRFRLEPSD